MNACPKHPYCTRFVLHGKVVMCYLCYRSLPYKEKIKGIEERERSGQKSGE